MALTNAEKQARYRQRQKEKGLVYRYVSPKKADTDAVREQLAEEERQERLKAVRKAGKEAERKKYYMQGNTSGIISCARFFVIKGRKDLAALILSEYQLSRQTCLDNGLGDFDLKSLDKAKVWDENGEPRKLGDWIL
jgi:hypothetical protein